MLIITDDMIGDAFAAINKRIHQIYSSPSYDENYFDKAIRQCRKIDPDCHAAQPE